jgi:creatinine amidohydrolase/Fe(II)-dependent formamide hydrolase-like protein
VMGDPHPATAENGARWVDEAATKVAAALTAMFYYTNRHQP